MFTGIITDIGTVAELEQRGDLRARITTQYDPATIDLGASIACEGVCLTVIESGTTQNTNWFDENWDGGDSWLMYNEEDGSGSESIGEWTFDQPMSIVYSTQMGSTTVIKAFGNFTTPVHFAEGQDLFETPVFAAHNNVPEPSAALLTILAMLGTLRRKR